MTAFVEHTLSFTALTADIAGQREAYSRMCRAFTPKRPAHLRVDELSLAGVAVRRYRSGPGQPPQPAVLFLHGGGWVMGNLDSHEFLTAALADDLGVTVLAVDYRLAPEHPFPAAFEDCLAVWRTLRVEAARLGVDSQRVAVVGDSAGGNLAAALCLALRDTGEPQPLAQALIYPALSSDDSLPSRGTCGDAPLFGSADLDTYRAWYFAHGADACSPYAMPLLAANFRGLAPAFISVAQFDPLHDDGVHYAKALREAGVPTTFHPGLGLVHGCLRAKGLVAEVDELYQAMMGWLHVRLIGTV